MNARPEPTAKKIYSSPALSKYGELATVTAAVSMTAKNMDGGPNSSKSG